MSLRSSFKPSTAKCVRRQGNRGFHCFVMNLQAMIDVNLQVPCPCECRVPVSLYTSRLHVQKAVIAKVLIATKCDRVDDIVVPEAEGAELAQHHGIPFFHGLAKRVLAVKLQPEGLGVATGSTPAMVTPLPTESLSWKCVVM